MAGHIYITFFIVLSIFLIAVLGYGLLFENKLNEIYLPGETTAGHYQIEMKCSECHDPWNGVTQEACLKCHEEELTRVKDTHPQKKFRDPRNANKLDQINVMLCTTCHKEHRPRETREMGITLPLDYCSYCHQKIGEERPTHKNLEFSNCQTSGCHNYHDNQGTYTAFLEKHLDKPWLLETPSLPTRDSLAEFISGKKESELVDAPAEISVSDFVLTDYKADVHYLNDVSCKDCHVSEQTAGAWNNTPSYETCNSCHETESKGFAQGRHGMRMAAGLEPMQVSWSRLPMKETAMDRKMNCNACHDAHTFDTKTAATGACMECHNSPHVNNYTNSKHFKLWEKEMNGESPAGSGVSCASCHMPRLERSDSTDYWVDHNQNNNLRPNEKMIRAVCMNCHGLPFILDALADPELIKNNFSSQPTVKAKSMEWVLSQIESTKPTPQK